MAIVNLAFPILATLFALALLSPAAADDCTCEIANCAACNDNCTSCTSCNASAPFLNVLSGESMGTQCTVNCGSREGAYVPGDASKFCYKDKKCPGNMLALRKADGSELEIVCRSDCPKEVGYQDGDRNCYSGIEGCFNTRLRPKVSTRIELQDRPA